MLDTKTHASFAVQDGYVARNRLLFDVEDDEEHEPVKSGWLTYTLNIFEKPWVYTILWSHPRL